MYSSSPSNQWHGNIETSTDTLVPVIDSLNNFGDENHFKRPETVADTNTIRATQSTENGFDTAESFSSQRMRQTLPEVHSNGKPKPFTNGFATLKTATNDESISIQPEHHRMNISNGLAHFDSTVNSLPNGNANAPLFRRRNSSNTRQPPSLADAAIQQINNRSDSISPNTINPIGKFNQPSSFRTSLPSAQSVPHRLSSTPSTSVNLASISCPDGLAHALSEQNIRLQQIVHEHKVSSNEYK